MEHMEQYHIKSEGKIAPFLKNEVDEMGSSSRCIRGHNLHPRVTVLYTLSAISFFPSDNFLKFF